MKCNIYFFFSQKRYLWYKKNGDYKKTLAEANFPWVCRVALQLQKCHSLFSPCNDAPWNYTGHSLGIRMQWQQFPCSRWCALVGFGLHIFWNSSYSVTYIKSQNPVAHVWHSIPLFSRRDCSHLPWLQRSSLCITWR